MYFHHMVQGLLQQWDAYSEAHHDTWRRLYDRQRKTLEGKASPLYLGGLDAMTGSLTCDTVPKVSAMETQLQEATGWSLTIVEDVVGLRHELDAWFHSLNLSNDA